MNGLDSVRNSLSYIFGKKIRAQARLLRLARKESSESRSFSISRTQYSYFVYFFRQHAFFVAVLFSTLFARGVVEIALIALSRDYLSNDVRLWLVDHFFLTFYLLAGIFLVLSLISIFFEKSLIVLLTNRIRRRLFATHIGNTRTHDSSERHASLIAKISYHLPLVSLGVSQVLFGIWRWSIYAGTIGVIAFFGGFGSVRIIGVFVGVSIVLGGGAYLVSRYYVSQEVTLYSRIITCIDTTAADLPYVRIFGQASSILDSFDALVWLDSYFRIRRDLLMRMGYSLVFILAVSLSLVSHFLPGSFFAFIGSIGLGEKFLLLFLLLYFSRGWNEAVKVGLYIFPARLGIFLTMSSPARISSASPASPDKLHSLVFESRQVRLSYMGPYYRRIRFAFVPGDRVLFVGDNLVGKSTLARVFAGKSAHIPRAFKIILDGTRLNFSEWQARSSVSYFFDPNFRTDRSILECVSGRVKESWSIGQVEETLRAMQSFSSVTMLVSHTGNYHASAREVLSHPLRAFALHALHVLITKPEVIVIDNFWIDLQYQGIFDILGVIERELPHSIIIVFAHRPIDTFSFTQRYVLGTTITSVP